MLKLKTFCLLVNAAWQPDDLSVVNQNVDSFYKNADVLDPLFKHLSLNAPYHNGDEVCPIRTHIARNARVLLPPMSLLHRGAPCVQASELPLFTEDGPTVKFCSRSCSVYSLA